MDTNLISLLLQLSLATTQHQNLYFDVRPRADFVVAESELRTATALSDINIGYPKNWINTYRATRIKLNTGMAEGKSESLSAAQIDLIRHAPINSEIGIEVDYMYNNPVTGIPYFNQAKFTVMVVPDQQAVFLNDHSSVRNYIDQAIKRRNLVLPKEFSGLQIDFMVDEKGTTIDLTSVKNSNFPSLDKELFEIICEMPAWKPAEDSNGKRVKQSLRFSIGTGGC